MILTLTEEECLILLGLLEDLCQENDIQEALSIRYRTALKSIIQKLGGTYFGKL